MEIFQKCAYVLGLVVAITVFVMQGPQKGVADIKGSQPCKSTVEDKKCSSKSGKICEDQYTKKYDPPSDGTVVGFAKKKNAIGVSENLELNKCDTYEEECVSSAGLLTYSSDCEEE